VSDLTNEGRTGALVSYVYPDSPAAKAGIEIGTVVLRIHAEGQPKPIDVRVEEDRFSEGGFPWDRLDELPEQYYDRIPQPWPNAENTVSRTLTDIGFGKKFTVDFFHGGKQFSKEFEVTPSPAYYNSAPRYKAEALGLTVRDLTYEVRRYFQKKPDEPGVVVAKIEPGSKASVSGIKPYEIVTHVNDKPVLNVKDFEKLIAGQTDLRLSIKRMAQGRVVKINMAAVDKKPATPPKSPVKGPDGDDE
jgi:S1-C subfamily serine protease